jgi:hypothetical protein
MEYTTKRTFFAYAPNSRLYSPSHLNKFNLLSTDSNQYARTPNPPLADHLPRTPGFHT